jgi:hypothetical protein
VSLAKMVVDLLGAAEADAARETARDAQLDRLLHAVEDQGAMLLELAESVRALTAKLETPRVILPDAPAAAETLDAALRSAAGQLQPLPDEPTDAEGELDIPVERRPGVPLVAAPAARFGPDGKLETSGVVPPTPQPTTAAAPALDATPDATAAEPPAKRLPAPALPDGYQLLRRYLEEREATYQSMAADYGLSPNRITQLIETEARRMGPTTVGELRKAAQAKKGVKARARQRAVQQQLGRTQPPGTTGAQFRKVPISQARGS